MTSSLKGAHARAAQDASRLETAQASASPAIVGVYDAGRPEDLAVAGVMSGFRWPAATTIHYGFPTTADIYPVPYGGNPGDEEFDHDFLPVSAFTAQTFDAFITGARSGSVEAMTLTPIMGFTNLTLMKDPTATTATHMLVATSSLPPTAVAYYPGSKFGAREGDSWLGQQYPDYVLPTNGSYGSMIMLHEFGHALGLKHSFDRHEPEDVTVPFAKDFYEYTLMSYSRAPYVTPVITSDTSPEDTFSYGYPQTYMMLDIAALQQMYGANFGFRSGDTIYSWSASTGEVIVDGISQGREGATDATGTFVKNQIFQTIWDGGGIDTYDLSNYTDDLRLNLGPGAYSTFSGEQRTYLGTFPHPGSYYARGNVYNALLFGDDPRSLIENAKGGSGQDIIVGNQTSNRLYGQGGSDQLRGNGGDDLIDGGVGSNTAQFSGRRAGYTITHKANGTVTVADLTADRDGVDTLVNVKFVAFADDTISLEPNRAPTSVALSAHDVSEVLPVDMIVADIHGEDPDGDPLTYSLTANPGGYFRIEGSKLILAKPLDYESQRSHTITIKAMDPARLSATATMTIDVGNVDEGRAPEFISLSFERLNRNTPVGTLLGDVQAYDPDDDLAAIEMTFHDNGTFQIADGRIYLAKSLSGTSSRQIGFEARDVEGHRIEKSFTIGVTEVGGTTPSGLLLIGGPGRDVLSAASGNDTLIGAAGNDRLFGQDGDDRLIGGRGVDTLWGGNGHDIFVFNAKTNAKRNADKIMDFSADDRIWLDNFIFKALGRNGTAEQPTGLARKFFALDHARDRNDHIIVKKAGAILYDKDGSGTAEAIQIGSVLKQHVKFLKVDDFFVV